MRAALPPGPRAPGLLQALRMGTRALPFMERCAARYGDMFTLRAFNGHPVVYVHHPEGVREVFTADGETLYASNMLLRPILGKHSLLLLNGARHRRARRLMMPPFHGRRMRLYADRIGALTLAALGRAAAGRAGLGLHPVFRDISLEVILQAVLGVTTDSDGDGDALAHAAAVLRDSVESVSTLLVFIPYLQRDLGPGTPGRRFQRARVRARAFLQAQLDARRQRDPEDAKGDILALLLDARDEDGAGMTDDEIHDQLLTLVVAGHETTATALAWAVHWIHSTPGVLARVQGELDGLGPDPEPVEYTRLPYLAAVVDETMRRLPVLTDVGRYAREPFTLMGRELPARTMIAPCIYLTHQRPDLYPDPHAFRPERFLARSYSAFEFLPFGGGPRRCLGAAFALFEMKIVLGVLLSRYRVELLDGRTVPVRRTIVHAPRRDTPVRLHPRRVRVTTP